MHGGVERHQRVQAQHQVHALFERDRGMQRFLERAVHVVLVLDLHRRKQAGQRGAGLHRLRNRDVVPARRAEGRGLAGVQVGGHQRQAGRQLAEIVREAVAREELGQMRVHLLVREHAGRQAGPQAFQDLRQRLALHRQAPEGMHQQPGEHDAAACELVVGRHHEPGRVEDRGRGVDVLDEGGRQTPRGHAIGQAGCNEAAGRHAHIVVEPAQVQAQQGVLQRAQHADLIDGPQRAATGQSQPDAGRPGLRSSALHGIPV
jgi:hypothetical protein